ncbi:unnamed protein product [Orchesella dallaii]|uniref:Uncharacterized protein n=1 Tax=Orchesella dallaii TaxID=48710 RepID=A0ABP1PR82_9HEXA
MVGYRLFGILLIVIGISSENLSRIENGLVYQDKQVSREDVKNYLQPILYQKLLQQYGDSAVIQQAKTVVSEYLVDSLLDSAQSPAEPIRSETFARQNVASNGTTVVATTRRPLFGGSRPSQAHVIGQVDQIIQNVNGGNITGIVDQALRIRAPAPVQQLVNGIMNLVLCNPFNRLWNRCAGGGGIFDGRR